jgi:hypothetical protein
VAASVAWLLQALSPEVLRRELRDPHWAWREEFMPKSVRFDSYADVAGELGRFVAHMLERRFGGKVKWWPEHADATAARLLNEKLGNGYFPRSGEFEAMKLIRSGDKGGIRYVLHVLTEALAEEWVKRYLDMFVVAEIGKLTPQESLELARQYIEHYRVLPGIELEHPASIALRWREIVHQHARVVLQMA